MLIQVALQTTESNGLPGSESTLICSPYLALLIVADALLVASLREGIALSKFVECQEERHKPLISSEVSCVFSVRSRRLTRGKVCRFIQLYWIRIVHHDQSVGYKADCESDFAGVDHE
jgi:hypothetical protein